jgi:DNA repair exonuclease SbcCD nuclease subunit
MSIVCFTADIHIKLGQKNVPRDWQRNRLIQLAKELNKAEADYIVIAGDLLDVANPSIAEVGLMYDFLSRLKFTKGFIIPGNHEMETKTRDCFEHIESMLGDLDFEMIRDFYSLDGIDYIPYNIIKNTKLWKDTSNKMAVTHVRGEIPPHVAPEVDLSIFKQYTKVFAGDLHSHTNSQGNILYPGSPFTTSFHRAETTGANGYFIIETETLEHEWVELYLPQLIRKTVSDPNEMVPTTPHHTIYELEGSLEDLAVVKNSELLDKKITKDISAPATLSLQGSIADELAEYLTNIRNLDSEEVAKYVTLYKETHIDSD